MDGFSTAGREGFVTPGPATPDLARREVHVWLLRLDLAQDQVQALWPLLDAEEQRRADRFHFEQHRQRYICAHAGMRLILSRYLGAPAEAVRYQFSEYGKPSLLQGTNPAGVTFNLSHSHELGLVAVGCEQPVGVDIEHIRADLANGLQAPYTLTAGMVLNIP